MYLQLEDGMMAQSTLWYSMDERFRSQELYWEFFFPCPIFQLTCLSSWPVHGGICLQMKTAVQGVLGFPVPVAWGLSGPLCKSCSFLLWYTTFWEKPVCGKGKGEDFLLRWTQWWNKQRWLSRKTRDYEANSELMLWALKCRNWGTKPRKC